MTSYSKNDVFRIVVAVDNSLVSKEAIQYAINLCTKLKTSYTLDILYAVGLNPSTTPFGLLNKLDRMNNVDLQEDAKETIKELNEYLAKFDETKTKELIVKEDSKDIEYIIEDYINQNPPNMLIMGSTNKEGLQKIILGSVSEYCLHHCKCPVTIIKQNVNKEEEEEGQIKETTF